MEISTQTAESVRTRIGESSRRGLRYWFAPVTLFEIPDTLGLLASRIRHDSCPQSSMIRGVLSPGLAGSL